MSSGTTGDVGVCSVGVVGWLRPETPIAGDTSLRREMTSVRLDQGLFRSLVGVTPPPRPILGGPSDSATQDDGRGPVPLPIYDRFPGTEGLG